MNIVRYKPNNKSVMGWADSLFKDFFEGDLFGDNFFTKSLAGVRNDSPSVDIKTDEKGYTLEADLPGLTEKDIDVKVENNLLTISSKKSEEKEEKKEGYLLKERRDYSFTRSFVVPRDVDREKIEAVFKNGVLTLTMAKNPEAKPKQIEIKAK